MGFFDVPTFDTMPNIDTSGYGVLASVDNSIIPPFAGYGVLAETPVDQQFFNLNMFGSPTLLPDGAALIDQRANTSFFNFDQSKVSASIFDVMRSGAEAIAKVAIQQAGDSINREAKQKTIWGQLANNFRSTKTGQEIQTASYATQAQNFLMNPMIWLVAVIGIVALLFMRRG